MKNKIKLSIILICILCIKLQAQQDKIEYQRSSLTMFLLNLNDEYKDSKFSNELQLALKSWYDYPFPDKYNNHNLNKDKTLINLNTFKNDYGEEEYETKLNEFLNSSDVALQILLKWFNIGSNGLKNVQQIDSIQNNKIDDNGSFINNPELFTLIQERGHYNATEFQANVTKKTTRGLQILKDAGEQLINNTFVTFTSLNFVENKKIGNFFSNAITAVTAISESVNSTAAIVDINNNKNLTSKEKNEAIEKINNDLKNKSKNNFNDQKSDLVKGVDEVNKYITSEGYILTSYTWLYQLDWNDEVQNKFYEMLSKSKEEFMSFIKNNPNFINLKFIGKQKNKSIVTKKLFAPDRSLKDIVDLNMVRNVDNAFAKLQKKHEVFKPKVPVLLINPVKAEIGTKEGLKGGEKFEVLEIVQNPKTGLTEFKRVSTVKVNKKNILDNRYKAGELSEDKIVKDELGNPIKYTIFKGGNSKILPGMILRQLK